MVTTLEANRQHGKIERVESGLEDHGILTSWVFLNFEGSGQGFGELVLGNSKTDRALLDAYERSLCETFGVAALQDLVGKECYALRSFGHWNDHIVGLDAMNGRRFTHYAWRKKHFPETKDPLEERSEGLKQAIAHAVRTQHELTQELETIRSRYRKW